MNRVVIIGAGGHGRVIADIIESRGDTVAGFLDVSAQGMVGGFPVLGAVADSAGLNDCVFVIGIGDNNTRETIAKQYESLPWHTAVHASAIVSPRAQIGAGTVVMPGAVINHAAVVGKHCIVNSGAVVEHDCVLGDYAHISPNAALCGNVRVGSRTHIGAGAVVIPGVSVCADCVIGAGAVVVKDITESDLYVGVPARRLKKP